MLVFHSCWLGQLVTYHFLYIYLLKQSNLQLVGVLLPLFCCSFYFPFLLPVSNFSQYQVTWSSIELLVLFSGVCPSVLCSFFRFLLNLICQSKRGPLIIGSLDSLSWFHRTMPEWYWNLGLPDLLFLIFVAWIASMRQSLASAYQ